MTFFEMMTRKKRPRSQKDKGHYLINNQCARCDCGAPIEMMQHIFNECPLNKIFKGAGRPPPSGECKRWLNNLKFQI